MHFEFLVEDKSGEKAIEILAPKLLEEVNTFKIHSYKGIGHIPKGMKSKTDASKRIFLDQLPRLLRGYAKAMSYAFIIVICDLDDKDKKQFLTELNGVLNACDPKPAALFCLAIEELEAWYLGDLDAIHSAYPKAKNSVLYKYENDSICGTWELLADAIYKGGSNALSKNGWQKIGEEKSKWAESISPYMNVDRNMSPSFKYLYKQLRQLSALTN